VAAVFIFQDGQGVQLDISLVQYEPTGHEGWQQGPQVPLLQHSPCWHPPGQEFLHKPVVVSQSAP